MKSARVSVVMGSDSELPVMQAAVDQLSDFGVACEVDIVSARRTPDKLFQFSSEAHTRGIDVIIAGAGGAAHLPGMVAALSPLPIIGVPILILDMASRAPTRIVKKTISR